MADRSRKLLIKDDSAFLLTPDLKQAKPKKPKAVHGSSESKKSKVELPPIEELAPKRVFLYLQLQSIENVPKRNNRLSLKLNHKHKIIKLDDHYTESAEIDPYDLDSKPTFSITINQDSAEDLNVFSDNPLFITIYEHTSTRLDSEDSEDAYLVEPIAQGTIDLLPFFSKSRSINNVETFLYPTFNKVLNPEEKTCKTAWQIYSLQPLLKDIAFCNIVFITFEAIYNASPELLAIGNDLSADISLQSTIPNMTEDAYICSFNSFTATVIAKQDYNHKWQSVESGSQCEVHTLAAHTGCRTNTVKLFRELLCNEGVDYKFDEISITDDVALVSNAMRRFVLTQQLSTLLEEAVAFNEQQVLIEIYNRDSPDKKLLYGTVDLSIFLYPNVNACRFAVNLTKPKTAENSQNLTEPKTAENSKSLTEPKTAKNSKNLTEPKTAKNSKKIAEYPEKRRKGSITLSSSKRQEDETSGREKSEKPIFAIFNICLLMPITESCRKMSMFSFKKFDPEKLKVCNEIQSKPVPKTPALICEETYKCFDEQIGYLVDTILEKKMKTVEDAKGLLCCHRDELVNKITKLVSCDFNIRFPTDTSAKFSNLMTNVYKELVQRIYNILHNCGNNWAQPCSEPNDEIKAKIRMLMAIVKMLNEVGDTKLASFFLEKTKALSTNDTSFNFYEYLYSVEKQNFEKAKLYLAKPLRERHTPGEYFTTLIAIYINYVTILSAEECFNQALQYLLDALKKFSTNHPKEIAVWILLHCLYKSRSYLPGMTFTRWKYDNLPPTPYIPLPLMPISLWEIYNNCDFNLQSPTSIRYYNAIKLFLRLGLYKFARIVYENLKEECSKPEQYFMTTTFNILLNDLPENYEIPVFTVDKSVDIELIKAIQALINGHLRYYRGETVLAMNCYENLLKERRNPFGRFQLGLMRYAYYMAQCNKEVKAIVAFQACNVTGGYSLIADFNIGKALYNLNRLKEAEQHFAQCTMHKIHIPDVWAYLALVNIKMNNPIKALESWKYAKINPDNIISEEILHELRAIDRCDLVLYVDNCDV